MDMGGTWYAELRESSIFGEEERECFIRHRVRGHIIP